MPQEQVFIVSGDAKMIHIAVLQFGFILNCGHSQGFHQKFKKVDGGLLSLVAWPKMLRFPGGQNLVSKPHCDGFERLFLKAVFVFDGFERLFIDVH